MNNTLHHTITIEFSYDDAQKEINRLCLLCKRSIDSDPARTLDSAKTLLALSRKFSNSEGIMFGLFYLGAACSATGEHEVAMDYLKQSLTLSIETGHYQCRIDGLNSIAKLCSDKRDYSCALEYLNEAMKVVESEDSSNTAALLNHLGIVYSRMGDNAMAMTYLVRSLDYWDSDSSQKVLALNNIGNIYRRLQEPQSAIEYYYKAIGLCSDSDPDNILPVILGNLGIAYTSLGDYPEALENQTKALGLFEKLGRNADLIRSIMNTGSVYFLMEDYKKSLEYFFRALSIAESYDLIHYQSTIVGNIGEVYEKTGDYAKAVEYLEKSATMMDGTDSHREQKHIYSLLAQVFEKTNDLKKSIVYHKLLCEVQTKMHNEEQRATMTRMQSLFDAETARKEKEDYRLQNIELANALSEIESLNNHLMTLDLEKNEFLRIVAHDLKNPIGTIQMLARLLRSQYERLSAEEVEEFTTDIESLTSQMFTMITNLLDINAIEEGEMKLAIEEVSFPDIIKASVKNFREQARVKDIECKVSGLDDPAIVRADKNAMLQVLDNLISNAIKYSPYGKKVYIRMGCTDGIVNCEVGDEGPGISEEEQKLLFVKYALLKARPTAGEHSSGLGLAIAKKLANAMEGDITCESTLGYGSVFVASFPLVSLMVENVNQPV